MPAHSAPRDYTPKGEDLTYPDIYTQSASMAIPFDYEQRQRLAKSLALGAVFDVMPSGIDSWDALYDAFINKEITQINEAQGFHSFNEDRWPDLTRLGENNAIIEEVKASYAHIISAFSEVSLMSGGPRLNDSQPNNVIVHADPAQYEWLAKSISMQQSFVFCEPVDKEEAAFDRELNRIDWAWRFDDMVEEGLNWSTAVIRGTTNQENIDVRAVEQQAYTALNHIMHSFHLIQKESDTHTPLRTPSMSA